VGDAEVAEPLLKDSKVAELASRGSLFGSANSGNPYPKVVPIVPADNRSDVHGGRPCFFEVDKAVPI
jgi:hypothetical protein